MEEFLCRIDRARRGLRGDHLTAGGTGQNPERSFTKDGRVIDMRTGSLQDLIDAVLMFCGTPDQVYRQIVDFIDYTGGLGNLLIMAQGGHLDHAATADQLTLMAKEVMPRLKEYKQPAAAA